eukprot:scaffold40355_cov57-Phaeocystis_antarctica.AAC.1
MRCLRLRRRLIVGRNRRFRWQPRCAHRQPPRTLHERAAVVAGAAAEQQQQQQRQCANREEHCHEPALGVQHALGLQHVVVEPGEQVGRADHGGDHGRAGQRHGTPLKVLDLLDAHQLATDEFSVFIGVGADVRAHSLVEYVASIPHPARRP